MDPSLLEDKCLLAGAARIPLKGLHPQTFLGIRQLCPRYQHHRAFQRKARLPAAESRGRKPDPFVADAHNWSGPHRRGLPFRSSDSGPFPPCPCPPGSHSCHQCVGNLGTRTRERRTEAHACPSGRGPSGAGRVRRYRKPNILSSIVPSPRSTAIFQQPRGHTHTRATRAHDGNALRAHPVSRPSGRGSLLHRPCVQPGGAALTPTCTHTPGRAPRGHDLSTGCF